jgi:hypothetical protein
MATVAPATDCRRRGAVLSRMSTAVLFLGVVIIGAVASARWITSTTAVSSSSSRLSDVVCPSAVHLSRAMAVANYANNSLSMTERERERERELTRLRFFLGSKQHPAPAETGLGVFNYSRMGWHLSLSGSVSVELCS